MPANGGPLFCVTDGRKYLDSLMFHAMYTSFMNKKGLNVRELYFTSPARKSRRSHSLIRASSNEKLNLVNHGVSALKLEHMEYICLRS